ncbi:MAG: endonuclease/exonuclease/phosphatase family protein [Planctomycetaceae bacterium]
MQKSCSPFRRVLAALFLAVFSLPMSVAREPGTLRVLCYNIHYGQGNDGKYDLQRLADVINAAKPDLVALQEVDVGVKRSGRMHEVKILGELTKLKSHFGPTQHYEGGLYGNAILTNLPAESILIQPLPYTEATTELTTYPRGAIAVVVTLPGGARINFISTHFQHNVEQDRVEEAKAINQLFASDTMTTILAGDMNAVPGSEPIRILEEKWKNAIDSAAAPSAPSLNPRTRIDYVFHRGDSLKMISSEVIAEPMASDHCPVLAVFEVKVN